MKNDRNALEGLQHSLEKRKENLHVLEVNAVFNSYSSGRQKEEIYEELKKRQ